MDVHVCVCSPLRGLGTGKWGVVERYVQEAQRYVVTLQDGGKPIRVRQVLSHPSASNRTVS